MRKLVAGLITVMLVGGLLVVAAVRSRSDRRADSPEQCLDQMYQAMSSGNVPGYLNCFTGELYERLARAAEPDAAQFAEYLRNQAAPIKGRAILQDQTSQPAPDEVRLVVDRVYEGRAWEYQGYWLRREAGGWRIYAMDPAEPHEPPVAYGTPAFPTEETAANESDSHPSEKTSVTAATPESN